MSKGGHSPKSNRKIIKQIKGCKEVKEVRQHRKAHGYTVLLHNGEHYFNHFSSNGFHHIRRWMKKNTSLTNLKW